MNLLRITWSFLARQLEKKNKPGEVKVLLNSLRLVAKKLVGDESSGQIVEECALQLFLFFIGKDLSVISPKDVNELKKNYGAVDSSLAKEISKVI